MTVTIPTLDIQQFDGSGAFVEAAGQAFAEFGFCGVTGHDITDEVLDDAYSVIQAFFDLPLEVKDRYSGIGGARGYTQFGIETAKDNIHPDLKEFWQVGRELADGPSVHPSLMPNQWPEEVANFRDRLYPLWEALDDLGARMLQALALYLGLEQNWFAGRVDHGNSILRPLHYPPIIDRGTPSLRSAPHEDINLITLLVGSHQPGLEILTRDGDWIPVTSLPGTVVVNVGDMMQRLTNHVLPSTTHRVVNVPGAYQGESRYSIPFFFHPNPECSLAPLANCVTKDNPNRYPEPKTADEYLTERLIEIGLLDA